MTNTYQNMSKTSNIHKLDKDTLKKRVSELLKIITDNNIQVLLCSYCLKVIEDSHHYDSDDYYSHNDGWEICHSEQCKNMICDECITSDEVEHYKDYPSNYCCESCDGPTATHYWCSDCKST